MSDDFEGADNLGVYPVPPPRSADPLAGTVNDAQYAEEQDKLQRIEATKRFVANTDPVAAKKKLLFARKQGLPPDAAGEPPAYSDWNSFVKDSPTLADKLATDQNFAAAAQDDIPSLKSFEGWFGKWGESVDVQQAFKNDSLSQAKKQLGWEIMDSPTGLPTPEQQKKLDEIDKQLASGETDPKAGVISKGAHMLVSMAPTAPRVGKYVGLGAGAGALAGGAGGALAGGVGAIPGAIGGGLTGAGYGLSAGFAIDTAQTDIPTTYLQYIKDGADPATAKAAAHVVGALNGALMMLPIGKAFGALGKTLQESGLGKTASADLVRRLIMSNSGKAIFARLGARMAESGVVMALVSEASELTRVIGAEAAGANKGLPDYHGEPGTFFDVTKERLQERGKRFVAGMKERLPAEFAGGALLGLVHAPAQALSEASALRSAEGTGELMKQLGGIAANSKLANEAPELLKEHVNRLITDYGTVPEVKVPAEAVQSLFQKEGITDAMVKRDMPRVAEQLANVADGKQEIVIPTEDLAAHIAKLKSFGELTPDIRVKDELTLREAQEVRTQAEKTAKAEPSAENPVFNDVFDRLTQAGYSPKVARSYAAIWDAFAAARGKRLGVDPQEYYKGLNLGIDHKDLISSLAEEKGIKNLFQMSEEDMKSVLTPDTYARVKKILGAGASPEDVDAIINELTRDELTGANGQNAWKRFEALKKPGFYMAIDANDLKRVNDTLGGHTAGDQLLAMLGKTLGEPIRANKGKFFRPGGDEFTAHFRTLEEAQAAKAAITDALNTAPAMFDGKFRVSISLGLADSFQRADALSMEAKLEAKAKGRSGFRENPGVKVDLSGGDVFVKEDLRLPELKDVTSFAESKKVDLSIHENDKRISLSKIVVPKDARGSGAGSEVMKQIVEYADATGKTVVLSPSTDFGATSKARLVDFYKRFGFVENKGRNKNFEISESMYREPVKTLEQASSIPGDARGAFSFDQTRSWFKITLTGKANLSTFLHESGHAFLEILRRDAERGDTATRAELDKIYEFLGAKPGEELSTAQLEKWAQGMETYFMEGKAPSAGLREAFKAFASWMKTIYHTLRGVGVELTDEVRQVMDRLLATDEEIENTRQALSLEPAPPEGFTPEEHVAYLKQFQGALEEAQSDAERKTLRTTAAALRSELKATRETVKLKVNEDNASNAFEILAGRERLDGGVIPEELKGKKLDREAVEQMLGVTRTEGLKRTVGPEADFQLKKLKPLLGENGLDPEVAAPLLQFESGEELIGALTFASPFDRARAIRDEVNRRMTEKYPGWDGSKEYIQKEALKAVHSDKVGNLLWAEAKALGKLTGKPARNGARDILRSVAERRVEEMSQLEMQPGRFARDEARFAKAWAEALRKKDFNAAHEAKMNQILSHELWKATEAAREEVDSIRDYLKKFETLDVRKKIGKAGQDYLEAIDRLTENIELRKSTPGARAARASLETYLSAMENEDGATITIPPELRAETGLKNYRQMTLGELRAYRDAVMNIESMARNKNRYFDGVQRRAFQETATKLSEHIKANLGTSRAPKPGEQSAFERLKAKLRSSDSELKKIEFLIREWDGGQTAGYAHELVFQPIATAEARANEMYRGAMAEILRPMKELTVQERMRYDRTVDFLGVPLKLRDVLKVAMDFGVGGGKEGNRYKLLKGYGWTEEAVLHRLGELLNQKDVDMINHIVKQTGAFWPQIKEFHQRTSGVAPPQVEAAPYEINGMRVEGGYVPIVYDRRLSYIAEQIKQRKELGAPSNNFQLPYVTRGFTEARKVMTDVPPLELSLQMIPGHVNEVIHYLTHFEAVRGIDRLLAHPSVRKSIIEGQGLEYYNLLRPWLSDIADSGNIKLMTSTIDKALRHLRVGQTLLMLGGKISTALKQGLNLTSTMKEIGPTYTAIGMKKFTEQLGFHDPYADVSKRSAQVRDFEKQMARELLNDFDNHLSLYADLGQMKDRVTHFSMAMLAYMQKTVNSVTWYGAYEKALAEEHPRPEQYADSVVRLSQMGEGIKDKSQIQRRGGEATKMFTMMYSYFNVLYNQLGERAPAGVEGTAKVGVLAARWWWMVMAPVALEMAVFGLHGKAGKKDDLSAGELAKEYGKEVLSYTSRAHPLIGTVVEPLLSDREPRYAPWISTMLQSVKLRAKMVEGEGLSNHEKKVLIDSIGIMSHMPTTAAQNAYHYMDKYLDGDLQEPVKDLLTRSPGEWK